jgi:hypothetical protein
VSAKVLADIDPSKVDPWLILATIASDASAPAAARVSACRALIENREGRDGEDAGGGSQINARAIARMRAN